MLYDSYKNKLEQRRRRFERFWRFRLLYLLALLMLLAFAGAMMGVAGTVTEVSVPAHFTYGEPLSMQASTVFGGADFEFRPKGETEWSEIFPRAAGTYECRAVGTSVAGTSRPSGEIFSFTIDPLKTVVRVQESDLMYGDKPTFAADLRYDDTLQVNGYQMEESGENGYHIVADLEAVSIVSADGEDVTASYDVEVAERDVNKIAREITVHTPSETFAYDGKPHSAEEWEIVSDHGLAEGHRIEEVKFGSITDAGTKVNACEYHILDENDEDVTGKYKITEDFGDLTVTPRPVTVTTESAEFVYDGKAHTYEKIEAAEDTSLAEGQTFRRAAPLSAKNAGTYPNAPAFDILDAEGNSVKGNYAITEKFGTVTIDKVAITVTMKGETFTYDGAVHEYNTEEWYTLDGAPVEGERLEFTNTLSARDAKTYVSKPTVKVFAEDAETSENYTIAVEEAEVIIGRRPLHVTTQTETRTYDGKSHIYDEKTLALTDETSCVAGQEIKFTGGNYTFTAANEEGYLNDPTIGIFAGEENVTANYEIETQRGTVVILRRAVTVKTVGEDLTYDGAEHTYEDIEAVAATTPDNGLAEGQEIRRSDTKTWRKAGTYDNAPEFDIVDGEDNSTKSNYAITEEFGKINIQKIVVTVTTTGDKFTYDGKAHTYTADMDGAYALSAALAEGETVRYAANVLMVQSAGTYDNKPTIEIFAGTENTTDNYDLTPVYGKVTVDKIAIKVTTKTETRDYDGKPHTYGIEEGAYELKGTLADGQALRFTGVLTAQKADTYQNTPTIDIYAGDERTTDNYEIEKIYGTVTINKIAITVTMKGDEFTYDGAVHEYNTEEWYSVDGAPVDGERLKFSGTLSARDAKTYVSKPTVTVSSAAGDTTENYNITVKEAEVVINLRPLHVTTVSENFTYDGTEHTYNDIAAANDTSLAEGQEFRRAAPLVAKNARTYDNTPEFDILDAEGNSTKSNYEITADFGKINIQKIVVTVTTTDDEFTYDGKEHTYTADMGGAFTLSASLADGETVRYSANVLTAKNVGTYDNKPTIEIFAGTENTTGNYDLTLVYGKVTVDIRQVTLLTGSDTVTYDAKEHDAPSYSAVGTQLADGHKLVTTYSAWIGANTYTNSIDTEAAKIEDADGNDVTSNYKLTWEWGTVVINKRQVKLQTDSLTVTYDAKPHSVMTYKDWGSEAGSAYYKLVEGHTLTAEYPAFTNVRETAEHNNEWKNWEISNGKDSVTDNYEIEWVWGTITINKRHINITAHNNQWTYDGDEHFEAKYDVEAFNGERGLAEGHTYTATVIAPKIINVWDSRENELTYSDEFIGVKGGENCIENYEVSHVNGTVKINKREITVTTRGDKFTYDGQEHTYNSAEVTSETQLAKTEHKLVLTGYKSFIDADTYFNEMTVEVYANEENISDNYHITPVWGEVTIDRRPIEVHSKNVAERIYDGISWREEYENCEVVYPQDMPKLEGHEVRIEYIGKDGMANAGTHEIQFKVTIMANGNDVTKNYYNIMQTPYGTVTIQKRPLTVKTESAEFTYDGEMHTYEKIEAIDGTSLAAGQEFRRTEALSARNAAVYHNTPDYDIVDAAGKSTKSNYQITEKFGTVTINKISIKVTAKSETFDYDGKPHIYGVEQEAYTLEGTLAAGQELRFSDVLTAQKAGTYTNKPTIDVYAGDEKVTENYKIEQVDGEVVINKISITVTMTPDEFTYDGEWHEYDTDDWYTLSREPVADEWLVFSNTLSAREAKTYESKPTVTVSSAAGDTTENYIITVVEAQVIVNRRPIEITTQSQQFIYDGKAHTYAEKDAGYVITEKAGDKDYGVVDFHNFTVAKAASVTNVNEGDVTNELVFKITDTDDKDVTENYDFTFAEKGTISVTPRHVKFQSGSLYDVEYDADPHGAPEYEDLGSEEGDILKLVEGHTVSATYPTRTNVGKKQNIPTEVTIVNGKTDVTDNYYIEDWVYGEIEILARKVTLRTLSGEFVYDAQEHSVYEYEAVENSLVTEHNHTLSAEYPSYTDANVWVVNSQSTTPVTESKTEYNEWKEVHIFENGDDVTDNYEITWEWGTIVITQRPVKITTGSDEFVYDGERHTAADYTVEKFNQENKTGLVTGHIFTADEVKNTPSVDHVGSPTPNLFKPTNIKVTAEEVDVTRNYIFDGYYTYGILRVTPRPVKITTNGGTHVYDGQPFGVEEYTAEEYNEEEHRGLAKGQRIATAVVSETATITDVGELRNSVRFIFTVRDASGKDVSLDNYTFEYSEETDGILTVTKRPVKITTGTGEHVYDGQPFRFTEYAAEEFNQEAERGIVAGHTLSADYASVTNVWDNVAENNTVDIDTARILAGGFDVTGNYDIEWVWGTITVKPRPVEVTSEGGAWVYDGQPHSAEFAYEQQGAERGLLAGHIATATGKEWTNITDIRGDDGKYTFGFEANAYTDIAIVDDSGVDMLENYEIEQGELGGLRIYTPIYIYLSSLSKQYDGKPLTYDSSRARVIIVPAGAEGWEYLIAFGEGITSIGSLTAADVREQSQCTAKDAEGNDITAQNRFIFVGGNPQAATEGATVLTVKQRTLTIHTINMTVRRTEEGSTKERDYIVKSDDKTLYNLTFNTLMKGHTLQCTMTGKLLLKDKSAKNELLKENVKVVDAEGRDVTEFYDIKIIEGTIKWLDEPSTEGGKGGSESGGGSGGESESGKGGSESESGGGSETLPPEDKE